MTLAPATVSTTTDQATAIGTLTLAFGQDPLLRWFYPDARAYLTHFPEMVRRFGGLAFEHGTAFVADDAAGAALWLPPGVQPDEEPLAELITTSVDERIMGSVFSLFERMAEHHPSGDCWYLPVIGVDPSQQGRGIGSALLERGLGASDAAGLPAYLESSNPRNLPLYERHGFSVVAEIQAGDGPPIWPMLRQPRG